MSDWEIDNSPQKPIVNQSQSDWVIEQPKQPENNNLGYNLYMAVPRIKEDIYNSAANLIKNAPGYYESAKTEIPGAFNTIMKHPGSAGMQALAGSQELINNIAQSPLGISKYLSDRLNLLPKSVTNAIGNILPEDTTRAINQLFDKPKYPGEELIRGVPRNALNIAGGLGLARFANPLKYTNKAIAKDVLKTRNKLKDLYTKKYDAVLNQAEKENLGQGLRTVIPDINFDTALINEPKKSLARINEFKNNPTPKTAHDAKSDLLKIQRKLINKHESQGLIGNEPAQLDSIVDAIGKIESNMFTDIKGINNPDYANKYRAIQTGYGKEVIPYTKNKALNAFKKGELKPNELVNSLGRGKFAAMRGSFHPEIARRQTINALAPLALTGGLGAAGLYGLNALMDYYSQKKSNQGQ